MLENFCVSPSKLCTVFLTISFIIVIAGKFDSPIDNVQSYSGEKITLSERGKLVIADGIVTDSWKSRQGLTIISVQGNEGAFDVSMFPSFGTISFSPRVGDYIKVTGLLNLYEGKAQINPLSAESIQKIILDNNERVVFPVSTIESLSDYIEETVQLKEVTPVFVEKFTSRSGSKMLRFRIKNLSNNSVEGVFFANDWDENTYKVLKSGKPMNMIAKVTVFRGDVSLNGKTINSLNLN